MFVDLIKERRSTGRLERCTCWDCLQMAGLTPPMTIRDKYPRRHPYAVMEGEPPQQRRKGAAGSDDQPLRTKEEADRRALRASMRNREAI